MEKYIVLLRGINISGKNKISMTELKTALEELGYKNVITYLNSGNIIFSSEEIDKEIISKRVSEIIENKFNLIIPLYIMRTGELEDILKNKPEWWGEDNKEIYDNIIFIIPPLTFEEVYKDLGEPNHEYEKIENYKNNIFWSYNLKNYRKTNWWSKTASSSITNRITIRTANTMRKVLELCSKP